VKEKAQKTTMQPGDLVEVMHAGLGVPFNGYALIVDCCYSQRDDGNARTLNTDIFEVQFMDGRRRKYLTKDLKVVK